ncbi:MAG: NirD/YgiW/YdeI family stress tolerance protein [Desulfovibrionaceae bacterium]|nr:NirD/YgiW/YdeI family stress tolerance protein [Desulfovibrionaceae bacterium]
MRFLILFLMAFMLSATPAQADFRGPGTGLPKKIEKAVQAQRAIDDMPCDLTGNIVEKVGKDRYKFRDRSGTVVVRITRHEFRGKDVTPKTRVRLLGRIDDRGTYREVEVKELRILR